MKKVRKLSFFGILGAVIAVLFLISISFTQAQVKTQVKPVTPPGLDKEDPEVVATWAVRIPTSDSAYMFYGIGDAEDGYYEDNDENITVSVEKNSPGAWRRYFKFVYAFDFRLANENVGSGETPPHQVGFQGVPGLYEVEYPHDKPYCQFPGTGTGDDCMADFLNGTHPHAGGIGEELGKEDYQYFWFRVYFFNHDIESMEPGDTYWLGGNRVDPDDPGDYLSMVARYRQECYPEPAFHDVELCRSINKARAETSDPPNPQNIEIERLYPTNYAIDCEAVWRIWVRSVDFQGIDGFLKVIERYCTIEKNRIKWYYPMEAKGNFNFYIDFIKNPSTDGTG